MPLIMLRPASDISRLNFCETAMPIGRRPAGTDDTHARRREQVDPAACIEQNRRVEGFLEASRVARIVERDNPHSRSLDLSVFLGSILEGGTRVERLGHGLTQAPGAQLCERSVEDPLGVSETLDQLESVPRTEPRNQMHGQPVKLRFPAGSRLRHGRSGINLPSPRRPCKTYDLCDPKVHVEPSPGLELCSLESDRAGPTVVG